MKTLICAVVAAAVLCILCQQSSASETACSKEQYSDICEKDVRFYGAHACKDDESRCCYYMQDCPYGCIEGQCKSRPASPVTTKDREKLAYPRWVYVKDCDSLSQDGVKTAGTGGQEGIFLYLPYLLVAVFLGMALFAYRKKERGR